MKLSNRLLENLATAEVKNLLTITPEIIDADCRKNKKRIFTAAQFLQIQKRKRNFSVRRFSIA